MHSCAEVCEEFDDDLFVRENGPPHNGCEKWGKNRHTLQTGLKLQIKHKQIKQKQKTTKCQATQTTFKQQDIIKNTDDKNDNNGQIY